MILGPISEGDNMSSDFPMIGEWGRDSLQTAQTAEKRLHGLVADHPGVAPRPD